MSTHQLAKILRYSGFTTAYDNILDPAAEPWRGHIAFARVLMAEFRPELFVELGTYYGVSFFAVCQAVQEEGLTTRCCAIDSWEGDEQAGFYENKVYEAVKTHADAHYPDFTTLIRSLFDNALSQFEDESIDVLHIDGLHTYEAVRHDFDTWLPKVKPGGIILFHDVNEYRESFGAYRVWDEITLLSEETYLFRHSHGLGVWRKPGGEPLSTPLLSALLGKDRAVALTVDVYITGLADKEIYRIVSDERQKMLDDKQAYVEELMAVLNERQKLIDDKQAYVEELLDIIETLRAEKNQALTAMHAAHAEITRVTTEYIAVRNSLKQELVETNQAICALRSELASLMNSRSWKLTSPLRVFGRLVRSLVRPGSQCGVFAKLMRGVCALPASVVAYPSWPEWKQALRGGSSFFTTIESKAAQVFEHAQKRNALIRVGIILPLKFGLKVRQFGGFFPALTQSIKKLFCILGRRDFKQLLPTATPVHSVHLEEEWRFKPETTHAITRDGGSLTPGLRLAAALPAPVPVSEDADVVDIIIPVYNGRAHLEKLLPSLFANTSAAHRFVFIDDKSPDPEIWPWLQAQVAERDDCLLLQNDKNLGFPATVNRGAALSKRDFVILNTDTVVPAKWLERLMAPLRADPTVASATPFSNAATIFSFPTPNDDVGNKAFLEAMGLETLNAALAELTVQNVPLEAPTGVGFCMAISRNAWDGHFGFDAVLFGKGYGEEVDWCQRSLRSGWKHVLAPNLYVAHVHGGSFTPEAKAAQLVRAEETVNTLHPDYTPSVGRHIAENPWAPVRTVALLRLAASRPSKPSLYLGHCRGGGAAMYLERRMNADVADGNAALCMIYNAHLREYTISMDIGTHKFDYSAVSPTELLKADLSFLAGVRVSNLVDWPLAHEGQPLLEWVAALAKNNDIELELLFHDFYAVCPRVNMLTPQYQFCDLPTDILSCTHCANTGSALEMNMFNWRRSWQNFLDQCSTLTFFSNSTLQLVSRVYTLNPDLCRVVPHAPLRSFEKSYAVPTDGPICIVLVGGIGRHKGSLVVEELAGWLQKKRPDVKIVIIGEFEGRPLSNMTVTGPYNGDHLPDILAHYKATVALFPSVCPETFSYVVQELCQLEMPLVCFNLGAPSERVRDYPHGLVVEEISAAAALKALDELDSRRTTAE